MKKLKALLIITVLLFTCSPAAHSQVLITLLLGDKLNSDKLEFGLDGGVNFLNMSNTVNAKILPDWNLGFYFDFKLKEKLFLHTGVRVKAKMGTKGLDPYTLNSIYLDSVFATGSVERKINYFNVPVLMRYRIVDYFHAEGGIQLGLRYTAFDNFKNTVVDKDDLVFANSIKDSLSRLDAGIQFGLGYKLKQGKGMTICADYYFGFVDVNNFIAGSQKNSAIYLNVSVPIGKGKAEKKASEKAAEETEEVK
ncbi:MAG: PorT family protein [Chitinophagaceae bacterium]|nr:PorT family protein [Chitinophagaceae bacterium]